MIITLYDGGKVEVRVGNSVLRRIPPRSRQPHKYEKVIRRMQLLAAFYPGVNSTGVDERFEDLWQDDYPEDDAGVDVNNEVSGTQISDSHPALLPHRPQIFRCPGGLADYVRSHGCYAPYTDVVSFSGRRADLCFEVAMPWKRGCLTELHGFVNTIETVYGGTHQAAFEQALVRIVDEYVAQEFPPGTVPYLYRDEICTGLIVVLHVTMNRPWMHDRRLLNPKNVAIRHPVVRARDPPLVGRQSRRHERRCESGTLRG